jgi:hypothetical protein
VLNGGVTKSPGIKISNMSEMRMDEVWFKASADMAKPDKLNKTFCPFKFSAVEPAEHGSLGKAMSMRHRKPVKILSLLANDVIFD